MRDSGSPARGLEGCPQADTSYADRVVAAVVADGALAFTEGRYGEKHPQRLAAAAALEGARRALDAFGPPSRGERKEALRRLVDEAAGRAKARGSVAFEEEDYVVDALLTAAAAAAAALAPDGGAGGAPGSAPVVPRRVP